MWEPSFLAFNISPQYKVYVDGVIKATTEQNYFVFSKLEHSCDSHQIRVEAYNEVGSNTSEHIEVVLPAGVCVYGMPFVSRTPCENCMFNVHKNPRLYCIGLLIY